MGGELSRQQKRYRDRAPGVYQRGAYSDKGMFCTRLTPLGALLGNVRPLGPDSSLSNISVLVCLSVAAIIVKTKSNWGGGKESIYFAYRSQSVIVGSRGRNSGQEYGGRN